MAPTSPQTLQRRKLLAALGAGALVVGFDAVTGRWVREAEAHGSQNPFHHLPALDGTLHLDPATREGDSTDLGQIVTRMPAAVLRPASADDVKKMVRFCYERGIQVAARGQHHSTFGQGLTAGLIIETQTLNTIHAIGPDGADIDAGVLWTDLMTAAVAQGLRPRGLTGFTGLSVGGTLSVGGCPVTFSEGGLVDHVQELTVVTGKGHMLVCSENQRRDLFEAVLAGLGQCGIIVRAKIDLVPAQPRARTYLLYYTDNAQFFGDMRELLNRGELDECFAVCLPPGIAPFVYQLNATIYYDAADPPDDAALLAGLSLPPFAAQVVDRSYVENATFVDGQIAFLRQAVSWDALVKPWFDVWLPGSDAETYIGGVMANLTVADIGVGGFILILPQRRSAMTRPNFRVPENSADDWAFLFDITTTSFAPGPDPAFADAMLARNRVLFDEASELGGTRYPIGALAFSREDWRSHYGDAWGDFRRAKHKYDPERILTPGPAIFGHDDDDHDC